MDLELNLKIGARCTDTINHYGLLIVENTTTDRSMVESELRA
jgi:hypothetical protein